MNGNPSAAYRHLTWEPILDTFRNLESLISEENPITLRYLYVSLHDINLAHLLASIGYYSGPENYNYIPGVDFNSSVRFEIMEKVIFADDEQFSLDEKPIPYIRMYFDELALPCDAKNNTICPLSPFIDSVADATLLQSEQL